MSSGGLPLPREHGAWLTLAGATVGGIWQASDRWTAGGFALALAAAFLVRAPLERIRPARWDGAARLVCGLALLAGALVAGRSQQWIGACAALGAFTLIGMSWWVHRIGWQRSASFEAVAMAALGASAGVIALAGQASAGEALALGLVLGTHAGVSVPLVRSDLRPRERPLQPRAITVAAGGLAAAALFLWTLGSPAAAVGLAPRALDLTLRTFTRARLTRAALVGIRETVELGAAITLVLLLI